MASGGNYAKACGLRRKKYLRAHRTQNWPLPWRLLQLAEWANAKNAPKKGDPLGLVLFEGIENDIFHITNLTTQEIEATPPKKCDIGQQSSNEQFIARIEQKSAHFFL